MISNHRASKIGRNPHLLLKGGSPFGEKEKRENPCKTANELYCAARAAVRPRTSKQTFFSFSLANLPHGKGLPITVILFFPFHRQPMFLFNFKRTKFQDFDRARLLNVTLEILQIIFLLFSL